MKQIFCFKYLFTVLLLSSLVSATYSKVLALTIGKIDNSVYLVAQTESSYDRYMQLGYAEAQKRNYRKALSFFQQALQARSGDRYATRAIRNVQGYIDFNRLPRLAFNVGNPSRRRAAATRGGCLKEEQSPIPLIPSDRETLLTTAEYPSLFFYVPQIQQAKGLELVIRDDSKFETLQKVSLNPSGKAGIVRVNLTSKTGKPLEPNKQYTWGFSVICDFQNRDNDLSLQGSVKRVLPDENLTVDLKTAAPQERIEIYVENKYWEDALRTLADLRLQNSNYTEVKKYWEELLQSVNLEQVVINASVL
ncbi:DUF928 domain-containing protein [Scytonema sp. UIC 10036]|uniref:DUF928 domain-containing protein n=1 Tax=Scytonema sp. UIC 10036 TaxID=2304196 RepID=UPI0012DADC35|nr:DUF928 domain-containing protein [Scytonema sp. UIC 10036]MUG93726.1 DUF928 domain-containing protein [Scytonema sp. UIC 10036]